MQDSAIMICYGECLSNLEKFNGGEECKTLQFINNIERIGKMIDANDKLLYCMCMTKLDGENGFYYMHPSDSDLTIAGAGTLCYEAINQLGFAPDAIFASCGGGGLLSGTYLAKELTSPTTLLFGCEPENANDAYKSVSEGEIFRFSESPDTVADGLRTLGVSERTFQYLKKLDGIYLGNESDIYYWTAWLIHLLKIECEPSCAINMTGITQWIKTQSKPRNILVLISGGNIDPSLYREIWSGNFLAESLQSRC